MRVLGIDPGIDRMGYCILDDTDGPLKPLGYGLISTDRADSTPVRLGRLHQDLLILLERHHPDVLAIETLLFSKNVTTAMTVSAVRGIVLSLCALRGMEIIECNPMEIKKGITGYGRSGKAQIQKAVTLILRLPGPPEPDDVADALAIGIFGHGRCRFMRKTVPHNQESI